MAVSYIQGKPDRSGEGSTPQHPLVSSIAGCAGAGGSGRRPAGNRGYVAPFDGATQTQLFRWDGAEHFDEMGRGVAFGDVNGDGTPDIVLGVGSGSLTDYGGYVLVMNGADFGQELYHFTVVGARWGANGGYVRVFDGPTGALVDEEVAAAAFDWLGQAVAAGDVDLNGRANVGAGAYQGDSRSLSQGGYVRVYSQ
jgi:hypothetical protein